MNWIVVYNVDDQSSKC